MNLGLSKKVIFVSFLFINFIPPGQTAEFLKIKKSHNQINTLSWSKISKKQFFQSSPNLVLDKSSLVPTNKKTLNKNENELLADKTDIQRELIIQSDKQSEIDDVIYAEGDVSVSFRGNILKADNITYQKVNKKITASGNIALLYGKQIFRASRLEYDFTSEKGYLLEVKGFINTNTLMNDLSSNFNLSDAKKLDSLVDLKKKEVLNTPGKVDNWVLSADKMTIDGNKWKSEKAILTNDLLELKQLKLAINSLQIISEAEKLRFKSSINYLIFEENVAIPFWLGDKTLTKSGEPIEVENIWNIGYDNLDKDGYFIGRKFTPIDISDDFVLNLEPQFLIQRSLKGYTKSFVKKDESITSEKVKRNIGFEDYFAVKSQIKGEIYDWDLKIDKNLNSLDINKFSDAFRLKAKLNKEINFLDSKWEKSFYGIYRERVWNGTVGESEIYSGYGSKLQKENTWVVNDIKKKEILSLGLANIRAEALNTKNLETSPKGNLFYSLDQNFPISNKQPKNKSIDISYKYIPEPITKGLSINTRLEASYSFYENGNHHEYLGLGIGPELIIGNFKNKTFDYTRLNLFPFYKFKRGESVFKFDHNFDKLTLNIGFDQQLYGPLIIKSIGTLNLTNDSADYGKFIDSKVSLNWKKRSYEIGVFYQPHNQAGGLSFSLFGFK